MNVFEKLDATLGSALRAWKEQPAGQGGASIAISLTFTGSIEPIAAAGFELHSVFLDQAFGTVNFADIAALAEHPHVVWMAAGQAPRKDLDTAIRDVRVRATNRVTGGAPVDGLWHVDASGGPLTSIPKATGRGVIVAIIDTGIDYTHPMFVTNGSPDKSRILKIWDQGLTPASPAECPAPGLLMSGLSYGVEYDTPQIDQALNGGPPLRHRDCDGHGTHVAGIAAGGTNFTALFSDAKRVGAAPEADIIAVKYLDNPDTIFVTRPDGSAGSEVTATIRFKDAVLYCLRTARSLGKPVVINLSLGNSAQAGDGLDDHARFVDALLDPSKQVSQTNFPNGALVVKSAGNEGNQWEKVNTRIVIPASGELVLPVLLEELRKEGETRLWQNCARQLYKPTLAVHFWYRRPAGAPSVSFAFRTPAMANFGDEVFAGGQREIGVQRVLGPPKNDIVQPPDPKWHRIGLVHENTPPVTHPSGASIQRNYVQFYVKPKESGKAFSYCEGTHELRIRAPAGTELFAHAGLYSWNPAGSVHFRVWFIRRDGTALGTPELDYLQEQTCFDPLGQFAVTVAAYDDVGGTATVPGTSARHDISETSSQGPLRDYSDPAAPLPVFPKPDIAAPGVKIGSAMAVDAPNLGFQWPWWYWGARFQEQGGTSMATPVVAGIAALILQKNPNLNATQVKAIIRATARPGVNPAAAPASTHAYGAGMIDGMPSHVNTP